ncbi:172_t:CDS:2, partial [Gigaspora margarita]
MFLSRKINNSDYLEAIPFDIDCEELWKERTKEKLKTIKKKLTGCFRKEKKISQEKKEAQ